MKGWLMKLLGRGSPTLPPEAQFAIARAEQIKQRADEIRREYEALGVDVDVSRREAERGQQRRLA